MSALRDLLDIPREVRKSSFVVRLTEGVAHPQEIIASYAATPDIVRNLDVALEYVEAAIRDKRSEAAYVHGSFGSGKSHFMAVLSLLLANEPVAWAETDLHGLRAKHEWVKDRKILRLHFHMVGARSSEEAVFPAYMARIRELHPDAPVPPLFEDEALFENAQQLRAKMGDAPFFAGLNTGTGGTASKRWGKLAEEATWDATTFDRARVSSDRDERARLFSALVRTHFPAFAQSAGGLVGFDVGLGRLARHAAALGYDAVAFFLDELILWLASRAGDKDWLALEVQKLAKLVEAQDERRDVPIVSFIARQRDIAEMVGDQFAGKELQTLRDSLRWWEGRFNTIKLEDRNLPTVVEKRVVRPKDATARKTLDEAFDRMRRGLGQQAWATLLGDLGDEKAFRQVYPFSPALIETLVAQSSYLQRERTALKVLIELLVEHLEDFEMGRLVAVGDLFDVLAGGEEPMDGHMRERFAAAKRLYTSELLPRIQSENGTATKARCQRLRDDHPVALGCSNCREARCRADNRLVKTLLLAALAPEVKVLREMTASRLVQLNHGTLKSPIPGEETAMATARLRSWSAEIGKLRVEGEGDPRVSVVLEGVDVRPILESARGTYSPGAGRKALRDILFEALNVETGADATVSHKVKWRGTWREGVVQYWNVREMDDAALKAPADAEFKLIIDYPFDDPGHGPNEDEEKVVAFCGRDRSRTIVWLPNFFGDRIKKDLMDLVVIDRILEDAMRTYLAHLRPDDQRRARDELEHMRSQKRARVRRAMEAAYGLKRPEEGDLDAAHRVDRHIHVLIPGVEIRGVTESVLDRAVEKAVSELLSLTYPRHPQFRDGTITAARLKAAHERLERLCEADGQRLPITRPEMGDWEVLQQLGIVDLTEAYVRLRSEWVQDVDRVLRQDGIERAPTADQLRKRLDPAGQRGLTPDVADLEVVAYVTASRRELLRGGNALREWVLGKLPPDAELVQTPLPEEKPWQDAVERAGKLFGVALGGRARNARNLRLLFERVSAARAGAVRDGADKIADLLSRRSALLPASAPRLVTAERAAALLAALDTRNAVDLAQALGTFDPAPTSLTAIARHIEHAVKVGRALSEDVYFNVFEALQASPRPEAREILERAQRVLGADQLNMDLAAELPTLSAEGQRLLHGSVSGAGTVAVAGFGASGIGEVLLPVKQAQGEGLEAFAAARQEAERALAEAGPGAKLLFSWKVLRRP